MHTTSQVKAAPAAQPAIAKPAAQPLMASAVDAVEAPSLIEQMDRARLGHHFGAISVLPPDPPSIQPKRIAESAARLSAFRPMGQGRVNPAPVIPAGWAVPKVQTKLTVGQPNDAYEQEADRVADQVMRMAEPRVQAKCACGGEAGPDGECAACKAQRLGVQRQVQDQMPEEGIVVQAKSDSAPADAAPDLESRLSGNRGSGQALPADTQDAMESAFGADFGGVRVHTDGEAVQMNKELNAQAFTHGSDIYFNSGKYEPESTQGKGLLAHELTHVVQQTGVRQRSQVTRLNGESRTIDKAGSTVNTKLVQPFTVGRPGIPLQGVLQRQPAGEKKTLGGGDAAADLLPASVEVTWGTDRFQINMQRTNKDGDRLEFIISYVGPHPVDGPFVENKSQRVSVMIGSAALKARVTRFTNSSLEVDLYSDRSRIVRLTDDAKFDDRPIKKGREHDFTLAINGKFGSSISLWVLDPKAQASDIKPTAPEISPGTNPGTIIDPADGAGEIRIDGDGDQYPELLLRMKLKQSGQVDKAQAQQTGNRATKIDIEIIQIASGDKLLQADFDTPPEASGSTLFLPIVRQITDGLAPTTLSLFVPEEPGSVEIYPPDLAIPNSQYRLAAYGKSVNIPYKEKSEIHKVASPDQVLAIGNIASIDVALGAYADRFRLTLQPTTTGTVIFGISALSKDGPVGGMGAELQYSKSIKFSVINTGATSLGIDLDNDGKADLLIFDQLTTPEPVDGGGPPESNRNHRIRLTGSVSGEDKFFDFKVRDNYLMPGGFANPSIFDKAAETNALAVTSLTEQEQLVDKAKGKLDATGELDAIDRLLGQARQRAFDEKLIKPETFNAWDQLARDFILLDPQIKASNVDATLQRATASHAQEFYNALASETKSAETSGYGKATGKYKENPYTGLKGFSNYNATPDSVLVGHIQTGRWDAALTGYRKLVNGLDRWIANALRNKYGTPDKDRPDSNRSAQMEYLTGLRQGLEEVQTHNPIRIAAVFHPDERNAQTGRINEIPLSLYYWRDGNTWHLKDATDDDGPNETASVGTNETEPPYTLFLQLAESPHYPAGIINYQMPGGAGGQVKPTGPGTWRKVLAWIGIGAAAIGLGLVTFGEGTVVVIGAYALGASAAVGGGMALLDLVERGIHGNLSAQTAILDSAQIIASLAGLGVLRAGRILSVARAAAAESVPLTESAALSVQWAMRYVVPLAATNIGADVVTLAVFTEEAAKQYDAIDKMPGTDESRQRAKMLLIGQMALTTGLTALSVRGNAAEITFGRNFDIIIVKGVPVAIPKGVSVIGKAVVGRRPRVKPDVDEATFFAQERAHLEGIRSDVRAPAGERGAGGEALAQVEDLALRTAWRNEEARRILEPIQQGARPLAEEDAAFRKQLGQFMSDMQAILDNPALTPPQKQAVLRARVKAFETAHPTLQSKVNFSAVDSQIGSLGGEGAAGVMVADQSGNLVRNGQPAGTLPELVDRVARANNASAAHGIDTEYVVDLKPGTKPGTTHVKVVSRPRSPVSTPAGRAPLFTGVAERAQLTAETLSRMRGLHPGSQIEVLPDGQIRINRQLEIQPADVKAMPDEDLTNLLRLTKELQSHDGTLNAADKKILTALTKKYRLRLEYERQQVDEMLRRMDLLNSDGTSPYKIFEHMSTVDRNRIFNSVLKASLPTVETSAGTKTDPALRSQAMDYALARNPDSVASFVRHFEFYVAEFTRRVTAKRSTFDTELNKRLLAAGGDEAKRQALRQALMKEWKMKSMDGLAGQVLTEMGETSNPLSTSSATRAEVGDIYDRMAKVARYGGSTIKLNPGESLSSLSPENTVRRIQSLGDDVTFSTSEAVIYHARKHFKDLPSSDVVKSPDGTVLPENEMVSYLQSLATAIRNPTKTAKEIADASKVQGGSRSFEFPRDNNTRAVVYVNSEGKVTVATYGSGSD